MPSQTEENYLKAVYQLQLAGDGASASTSEISNRLGSAPASVSEMLKRMAAQGWLEHERYHGVQLTPEGSKLALRILRKHRLWETFLVSTLGFNWDEVHGMAEELEHVSSDELIERMDAYLNHPTHDPHGDPIPTSEGQLMSLPTISLQAIAIGRTANVVGVSEQNSAFLQYLGKVGIALGTSICVLERMEYDNSVSVSIGGERPINLSAEVSRHIHLAEPQEKK